MLSRANTLVGMLIFGVGCFVGYVSTQFQLLSIARDINVVDLLALFITTVLGFYIAHVVQRNLTAHRVERDLMIGHLNGMRHRLGGLDFMEGQSKLSFSASIAWFRQWFAEYRSLECLVEETIGSDCVKEQMEKLYTESITLKKLSTGGKKKGGCFQLDEVERKYFDESKRRVEELLFKLVVRINRKS
jgi:hypothetical protein